MPINEGSRCYLIPEWLAKARRAEVRRWANEKYAHVPRVADVEPSWQFKFPKERKPSLSGVMRDVAVLAHAALKMGEPILVWVEDATFYFNQFIRAGRTVEA